MDKGEQDRRTKLQSFAWMAAAMPGVARLMAERRAAWGNAHCNECFTRGVLRQEPGWFFAREGVVTVGVPESADVWLARPVAGPTEAVLLMRTPTGAGDAS